MWDSDSDYRWQLRTRVEVASAAGRCTGRPWSSVPNPWLCWFLVLYACCSQNRIKCLVSCANSSSRHLAALEIMAWSYNSSCLSLPWWNCCRPSCFHQFRRRLHCLLEVPIHSAHSSATSPLHHSLEPAFCNNVSGIGISYRMCMMSIYVILKMFASRRKVKRYYSSFQVRGAINHWAKFQWEA